MASHTKEPGVRGEVTLLEEAATEKKLNLKGWRLKQAHGGKAPSPNGETRITDQTHFQRPGVTEGG